MTLHNEQNEGLHRRPATSRYDQVFGDLEEGNKDGSDHPFNVEDIKLFETLLNERPQLLKKNEKTKTSFGDTIIGLIPIIVLALILLMFLFAIITVIKAFFSARADK